MHTAPSLHSKPQQRIAFLPLFNEMRCTCFEAGIHDPAAFQTILAIASADISLLRGEDVSVQAITHNTHSIRMLSKRLSNLSPGNMDGTIATVALHIIFLVVDLILAAFFCMLIIPSFYSNFAMLWTHI